MTASSEKSAFQRPAPAPETVPRVSAGDAIYYRHPDHGVTHGIVAAVGKHGVTCDHEDGVEHQVRWADYLGHRKREARNLSIVDRGEDGSIMADEAGKRVFVRGDVPDQGQVYPEPMQKAEMVGMSLLEKAQILVALRNAGFESMDDYVKDTFGEHFVYIQQPEVPAPTDVISPVEKLLQAQSAQMQGLCVAVSMLAEKIAENSDMQRAMLEEIQRGAQSNVVVEEVNG